MTNLVGQKFGKLTVISMATKNKWNQIMWNAYCVCGEQTTVRTYDLVHNKIKSCGCYRSTIFHKKDQI